MSQVSKFLSDPRYPLFGIYALAVALLISIWTWRLSSNKKQNAILSVVALLCIIAIPLFCYRYVYYQTNFDDIWTAALPAFVIQESYPAYYLPYYLLGAFFLLMVLFGLRFTADSLQKALYRWGIQGIIVVALIACVWHWWYKDSNFHHELVMQHCIEQSDWEGVLREGQKQAEEEPTRPIVMMHDLALSRLGRQLDEMYSFPRGNKKSNTPIPYSMLYYVFGRMIYYQYGMLNDCHRLCLEDGVEFGWHAETMAYMARCSILCGETQAAQKILNLLRHTKYHGEWADTMQQLLDNPKQVTENREMGPITHMQHYRNALGGDNGDVEKYVMGQLSFQDSDDPYFQEQAVLAALWFRDPKLFMARFSHYTRLYPQGPIPHIFQEAAYLFGKLEKKPDIDKFPFDKSVIKTYNAFMKEAEKYNNQSVEFGRTALYPFFGNTYFFEYYYLRNNH